MSYSNTKAPHSKSTSYINLNWFNYASDPVESLNAVINTNWQIKSLEISSHGANGVIFIQTTIGSFVLKMNNDGPSDMFFSRFASLIDVNVPEIKIIACYQDFFHKIVFQIEKFCQKDEGLSIRLRKRMDYPFYQLMEYIPSISFLQIGLNRFQKYQISEQKLQSMGRCIGFDLIINNNDRFKLSKVWPSSNQGNLANVLIKIPNHFSYERTKIKDRQDLSVKLGEYVFIDHSGFMLDIEKNKMAAQNFSKYIDKVTIFHDQIIQFLRGQLPCPQHFEGLRQQIQLYTKYQLSDKQVVSIVQGIVYSTSMFIDFFEQKSIDEILQQLYREDKQVGLRSQMKYWNEYWNMDLKKIKLKHLQIYHLKVSTMYAAYEEIIKQICERVAKSLIINGQDKIKKVPINGERSNSRLSNISNGEKLSQNVIINKEQQSNREQQQQIKTNNDIQLRQQQQLGIDYKQQVVKLRQQKKLRQEQTNNRLRQRLDRYLKKNYQVNYNKHNNIE